jgi:hypothetical protein
MTVEITIQVPDALGQQLQRFRERLPEVLERGLREVLVERPESYQDENTIMELLTSAPHPEQVLAIHPSPELQARVSDLLSRSKAGKLSRQEEAEMERYLMLEHLVRLAKAYAYQQLTNRQ